MQKNRPQRANPSRSVRKIQRIRFSKNNLCRNISDYTHWMVPMENEPLTGNPWAQPS
jgi:hypothetical protein